MLVSEDAAAATEDRPLADPSPTEAEMAGCDDAVEGLRLVESRLAQCSAEEQSAFWEAVKRCFGAPPPEDG